MSVIASRFIAWLENRFEMDIHAHQPFAAMVRVLNEKEWIWWNRNGLCMTSSCCYMCVRVIACSAIQCFFFSSGVTYANILPNIWHFGLCCRLYMLLISLCFFLFFLVETGTLNDGKCALYPQSIYMCVCVCVCVYTKYVCYKLVFHLIFIIYCYYSWNGLNGSAIEFLSCMYI